MAPLPSETEVNITKREEVLAVMAPRLMPFLATCSMRRSRRSPRWDFEKTVLYRRGQLCANLNLVEYNAAFRKGALVAQKPQAVLE